MIRKARYGAGQNYTDVTGIINYMLEVGYIEFLAISDLFGDPLPGILKFLEIEFDDGRKVVFPEHSGVMLDGNLRKIKIFTVFTADLRPLSELYLTSIRSSSSCHLEPVMIECPLPTGEFLSHEFKRVIDFKIERIIETIRENIGQIIVWSDIDIVFLKNPYQFIVSKTWQYDVSYMNDGGGNLSGGFYAIRCSSETLGAWTALRLHPKEAHLYEQAALNEILSKASLNLLPDTFWAHHRQVFWNHVPPQNIVAFHATGCDKLQVLQDMMRLSAGS